MASTERFRNCKGKLARKKDPYQPLWEAYHGDVSSSEGLQEIWGSLELLVCAHEVELGANFTALLQAVKARDVRAYLDIATCISDPLKYDRAALYWGNVVVASFLKKFPFGKVAGLDPEAKARERSEIAEKRCRIANRRIAYYSKRWYRLNSSSNRWFGAVFHSARMKIQRWLGPVNLNEVYDHARHGPGGALGCHRPFTTAYFKYAVDDGYTVSARCEPYAEAAILADPLWLRSIVAERLGVDFESICAVPSLCSDFVRDRLKGANYNRVTYVPKTAQTDRAIAIEPLFNVYLQLGVGRVLKRRLAAAGCDLTTQERNQKLARLGSTDDVADFLRPSTMDMEMASDTLCIELVRELLPSDWYDLLSALRSPYGQNADGSVRKWAKFSSMGNGYTFELESLIFYALVLSTVEHFNGDGEYVSVFGDDIVVPHYWFPMVREVLQFAGFRTNSEKTFVAGPFRESCGKDFFEGTAVRPFYLKRQIKSRKDQIFLRNSALLFSEEFADPGYHKVADFVTSRLPGILRRDLLGPRTEDLEGHLHAQWDLAQASPLVRWNRSLQAWSFPTFRASSRRWRGDKTSRISGSFLYLQFMEGVRPMDRFDDEPEPPASSKAQVVLSGGSESRKLGFDLTYRWDSGIECPKHRLPPESCYFRLLIKSGLPLRNAKE